MRSNKPYYPQHTPPDLPFEEHHKYSNNVYNGGSIYESNIDGRSEYEIMNLFQEIGMTAIALKARNTTDKQAYVMLLSGFNGALQNLLINHVK